jgi:hypothetical protein
MSFKLIWSRSHSLDSFSRCTALMPKITNSNIIEHGPKLVEAVLWCAVSLNHRPDRPWKPGLMARKNNISKIGRATQIIMRAISDIVIFCLLLITRSMIREAVPDKLDVLLSLHCLPLPSRKSGIVALYLLSSSGNLPLRSTGVYFFRLRIHRTRQPFLAESNVTEWTSNYQGLRKIRKGTDICESESSSGG